MRKTKIAKKFAKNEKKQLIELKLSRVYLNSFKGFSKLKQGDGK